MKLKDYLLIAAGVFAIVAIVIVMRYPISFINLIVGIAIGGFIGYRLGFNSAVKKV